jgi:hypothetical protein
MPHATFFLFFWVTLIGLLGMLGLGTAALAGAALRSGEFASGGATTALALACGLLCGIAQDACRSLGHPRR